MNYTNLGDFEELKWEGMDPKAEIPTSVILHFSEAPNLLRIRLLSVLNLPYIIIRKNFKF